MKYIDKLKYLLDDNNIGTAQYDKYKEKIGTDNLQELYEIESERIREYRRVYYQANRERLLKYREEYWLDNKEEIKDKYADYRKEYYSERRKRNNELKRKS